MNCLLKRCRSFSPLINNVQFKPPLHAPFGARFIYRQSGVDASRFAILRSMFKEADVDGNGFLDRDEVKRLLNRNADAEELDDATVERYFLQADTNQDGKIDHMEFMRLIAEESGILEKVISSSVRNLFHVQGLPAKQFAILHESFMEADLDGNGILDKAEVRRLLEKSADTEGGRYMVEEELASYFLRADTDNDSKINLKEFLNAVEKDGLLESSV